MDQCIYEPTTQKLFGVRGQWVLQFNSVTGAFENALRFMTDVAGTSTIAAIGGKLYIGVSWQPIINWSVGPPTFPDVDIYVVNAASLTVTGRLNLFANIEPAASGVHYGWRTIVPGGNGLIGVYMSGAGPKIFNVDPNNTAGFTDVSISGVTDIAWDTNNLVIWLPTSFNPNIACFDPNFGSFLTCFDTNGNLNTICGITYNTAQNKVLAVDGTFNVYSFSAALAVPAFTNFAVSTFNTGRINANPFRIKSVNGLPSNPMNGKVLIPTWNDDTVLEWNPATNGLTSIKSGFTAPFDIVSTPTKNWALQTGITPLKEIV